jgi:hypothetical protein
MSRKPMVVPPGALIFKKQTIRGFWLLFWYQSAKPDELTAMFDYLAPLIAAGTISTPVIATYGFDQGREAITKAAARCSSRRKRDSSCRMIHFESAQVRRNRTGACPTNLLRRPSHVDS